MNIGSLNRLVDAYSSTRSELENENLKIEKLIKDEQDHKNDLQLKLNNNLIKLNELDLKKYELKTKIDYLKQNLNTSLNATQNDESMTNYSKLIQDEFNKFDENYLKNKIIDLNKKYSITFDISKEEKLFQVTFKNGLILNIKINSNSNLKVTSKNGYLLNDKVKIQFDEVLNNFNNLRKDQNIKELIVTINNLIG